MGVSKTVSGETFQSAYAERPDHRILIRPAESRLVVNAGYTQIADSADALRLEEADYPPVYYFPRADVSESLVKSADHSTWCPFKGRASYYSIGRAPELENAAWSYEDPFREVEEIQGYLAFDLNRSALHLLGG